MGMTPELAKAIEEKVGKDITVSIIEQAVNYARSSLEKKNYIFFTQETHSYQ